MEHTATVKKLISTLDSQTDLLKVQLEKITTELSQISEQTPLERCKLINDTTYSIISLLFSYIKVMGIDTKTHPIMGDLSRIRSYMDRVKKIENSADGKEVGIDTSAVKRIIEHSLGGGSGSSAISTENFSKGKHTKFETKDDTIKEKLAVKYKEKRENKQSKDQKEDKKVKKAERKSDKDGRKSKRVTK